MITLSPEILEAFREQAKKLGLELTDQLAALAKASVYGGEFSDKVNAIQETRSRLYFVLDQVEPRGEPVAAPRHQSGVGDIGWAVTEMRTHGMKVRRRAWVPGHFVFFQKAYPEGIPINQNTAEATGIAKGTVCKFLPYLMVHVPIGDGAFAPWIAGNTDLLATDWEVVQ
jgi:hypothetical protein